MDLATGTFGAPRVVEAVVGAVFGLALAGGVVPIPDVGPVAGGAVGLVGVVAAAVALCGCGFLATGSGCDSEDCTCC